MLSAKIVKGVIVRGLLRLVPVWCREESGVPPPEGSRGSRSEAGGRWRDARLARRKAPERGRSPGSTGGRTPCRSGARAFPSGRRPPPVASMFPVLLRVVLSLGYDAEATGSGGRQS